MKNTPNFVDVVDYVNKINAAIQERIDRDAELSSTQKVDEVVTE